MKITDKRKFTPQGELREEYRDSDLGNVEEPETSVGEQEPESVTAAVKAEAGAAESPGPAPPANDPLEPSGDEAPGTGPEQPFAPADSRPPDFTELVEMLVQPAILYLGDLALPDGQTSENLPLARRQIDLLHVLKEKTGGNLNEQEAAILEDILYRLRLRYVQKTS